MAKIKITLTKSLIARKKNHIATANSLGLRKPGDFKVIDSNPRSRARSNSSLTLSVSKMLSNLV